MRIALSLRQLTYPLFPDEDACNLQDPRPKKATLPKKKKADVLESLSKPIFENYELDLVLPALNVTISDEVDQEQPLLEAVDLAEVMDPDYIEPFTTEEILLAHSILLVDSLTALRGYRNAKQKAEILEWIFEADYVATVNHGGRPTHLFTRDIPFTFAFCCRLEHNDPEVYRDFIRRHLPEDVKKFFL